MEIMADQDVYKRQIVHRIDKDTSGLLVVAKSDIAHRSLSAQLAEHSITRKYEALVYDNFSQDEGTVDAPIGRDPKNRLRQAVITDGRHTARRAGTHWSVKERFGKRTLIQAVLETGRTQQIRVHMAYIRHPLVGDMTYGPRKQHVNVEGQLLHAGVLLSLIHIYIKKKIVTIRVIPGLLPDSDDEAPEGSKGGTEA